MPSTAGRPATRAARSSVRPAITMPTSSCSAHTTTAASGACSAPTRPPRSSVSSARARSSWSERGERSEALRFLAYEWTFLRVFWAMLAFFALLIVVWLIVLVLYDNFARHDPSGLAKAGWTVLVIALPFIGVLIYMIARPGTADRDFSGGGV